MGLLPVTIAIVTRNRKKLLVETLKSISKQTAMPETVIVVDNDSNDGTREEILNFKDFQIKYIHNPVLGINASRNCALKAADSEIFGFIDDDVELDKNYVQELYDFFKNNQEYVAVQGNIQNQQKNGLIQEICQFNIRTISSYRDRIGIKVISPSIVSTCSFSFRIKPTQDMKITYDNNFKRGGDREVGHQIIKSGYKIGYSDKVILHHKFYPSKLKEYLRGRFKAGIARRQLIKRYGSTFHTTTCKISFMKILALALNETANRSLVFRTKFFIIFFIGQIVNKMGNIYSKLKK